MKPLSMAFILAGFILFVNAQVDNASLSKLPKPAFLNHIYYYAADSLTALEKMPAQIGTKTNAMSFGGGEPGYTLDGERSTIRIKAGDTIQFVLRMGMASIDPSMIIRLYKFDSKKGNRYAILTNQGRGKKNTGFDGLAFNVQKSENSIYLLIPASKLGPGEYGFLNMMMVNGSGRNISYTVFAFGVDR
jgi:hypothetical protein